MKKLITLLVICLLATKVKSQSPNITTLIRYVNTPLANLTEEVISVDGWELIESEVVDSLVTLQFQYKESGLQIRKLKSYKNEVMFTCNKQSYDILSKSLLALKPQLTESKIDANGRVIRSYTDEINGYRVSIAPKGIFVFEIFDKIDHISKEAFAAKSRIGKDLNLEGSGFGETPIPLGKFTNLVFPKDDGSKTGKIAIRISIDKHGKVIEATPGVKGTTLNDRELWQKCKEAMLEAQISSSDAATDVQVGIVVFNFKIH